MINFLLRCFSFLRKLSSINLLATLRLNYFYFGLKGLHYFPIIAWGGVSIRKLKGKIILLGPLHKGVLQFGKRYLGTNPNKLKSTWEVDGTIILDGNCQFGNGMKLCCEGELHIGSNVTFTGNSHIFCRRSITIGDNSLVSWDVLIIDNDSHPILDENNVVINNPKKISIGDHVWIGCRSLILKGSYIPSNVVIGADSTIANRIEESHCIIGGKTKDIRILKNNISWHP